MIRSWYIPIYYPLACHGGLVISFSLPLSIHHCLPSVSWKEFLELCMCDGLHATEQLVKCFFCLFSYRSCMDALYGL